MNLEAIEKILARDIDTRNVYIGGCTMDSIPYYLLDRINHYALVLNTDTNGGPGKHWLAVYYKKGLLCIFDSLADDPFDNKFLLELIMFHKNKNKIVVHYNVLPVQSPLSNVCGLYVIYFILYMCRDKSYLTFNKKFDVNRLTKNDIFVKNILSSMYPTVIDKIEFII